MKRWEAEISTNTKIFEKNPSKGGTPASERMERLKTFVRISEGPKFDKEKRVLKSMVRACIRVEKSKKEVIL